LIPADSDEPKSQPLQSSPALPLLLSGTAAGCHFTWPAAALVLAVLAPAKQTSSRT